MKLKFWKKEKELTIIESIFEAMKLLENKGIYIKTIDVSERLLKRMRAERLTIDDLYNKKEWFSLLYADSEFACFLDKDKIPKRILKTKPKNFEGMIFGINIISELK